MSICYFLPCHAADTHPHTHTHTLSRGRVVHPFFSKRPEETSSQFQWLKTIGPKRSCLHGTNLAPPCFPKVAALDLDDTIIKYDRKNHKKDTALQWEWWKNAVPSKLQTLHEEG